jgi:hypothetical protein
MVEKASASTRATPRGTAEHIDGISNIVVGSARADSAQIWLYAVEIGPNTQYAGIEPEAVLRSWEKKIGKEIFYCRCIFTTNGTSYEAADQLHRHIGSIDGHCEGFQEATMPLIVAWHTFEWYAYSHTTKNEAPHKDLSAFVSETSTVD